MLRAAIETPSDTIASDIERLRESLVIALRRCLGQPAAGWMALVECASETGGWNEWRIGSLIDAADPATDEAPEVTREALAELAVELLERGDVLGGPWEGGERQAAVASQQWRDGRDRRELIFAIERAMDCLGRNDAAGLHSAARRIEERDPDAEIYPDLAESLRICADWPSVESMDRLQRSLLGTPFAAFVCPVRS